MSPRTRIAVSEFWEFVAFFTNSILFLLIGDQFYPVNNRSDIALIGLVFTAVLITRTIGIFGLTFLSNRITQLDIDLNTQTMLWWSGLRGDVSLALALSVPADLPERHYLQQPESKVGVELATHQAKEAEIRQQLETLQIESNKLCQEDPELLQHCAG